MLIAELTTAVGAFIDCVVTGRFLGSEAVAVYAVSDPYFSIAAMIRCFLMAGCVTLCTRALGKGDKKKAGEVFSLSVTTGLILAVILMLVGLIFTPQIAAFFGARGNAANIHGLSVDYFRGLFLGAPAFVLFVILIPILQLDGDSRRPRIGSIIFIIVDVTGDLLNVMVFKGGMFGMGLTTALSQYAVLITLLTHFIKKDSLFKFSLRGLSVRKLAPIAKDGLPSAVSMFCRALMPILLNPWTVTLAASIGLTALSVQHNLNFMVGALGWGIGGAVLMMAGISAGEQDVHGLTTVTRTALWDILIGVGAIAAVVFFAAPLFVRLYIPGADAAVGEAVMAVRLYGLALPFIAFNVASANFFQATERIGTAMLINAATEVIVIVIPAWILGKLFGITGVWMAFPVGHALLSLLIILRSKFFASSGRKGLAAWLRLKPDFGVPDEDYLSEKLNSLEEVAAFSQKVEEFCLTHGLDARQANHIALCVEELASNVVEHGFRPGNSNYLDVRVVRKGESTILRFRDDCRHYNFKEKAASWAPDPEHPEAKIGLRIVLGLAKDIAYANTLDKNNLVITL